MILENKKTTVFFRCPSCGGGVESIVDLFRLSADMVKLKCTCGASALTAVYSKGVEPTKIKLTVPCIFCTSPHKYTLTAGSFFGRELFTLDCPNTGIPCLITGNTDHVKAEAAKSELEILDFLESNGLSFRGEGEAEELVDPLTEQTFIFAIRELDGEGRIRCRCGEGEEHEYELERTSSGFTVSCGRCKAKKEFDLTNYIQTSELLEAEELILE